MLLSLPAHKSQLSPASERPVTVSAGTLCLVFCLFVRMFRLYAVWADLAKV